MAAEISTLFYVSQFLNRYLPDIFGASFQAGVDCLYNNNNNNMVMLIIALYLAWLMGGFGSVALK